MHDYWIPIAAAGMFLCSLGAAASVSEKPTKGYIARIPPESAAQREARHAKIAERRKGPAVIVHRGASAFAPENTLEAYAAAMDYGADGCEIDIRRTADGVLVLFHDDMLENLTNGFGPVNQLTYYELLQLKRLAKRGLSQSVSGVDCPLFPTLASTLALARQRAMLLHLDIKEPGIADEIAKLLDEADMWDAVVSINASSSGSLPSNPKFKPLAFKAPGLYEDGSDVDPDAVKAALARPGDMIILDDPRVAAHVLGRPSYQPVPIPQSLRQDWPPSHRADASKADELVAARYIAALAAKHGASSAADVVKLLDCSEAGRSDTDGDQARLRAHREKILARAWAAQRLGEIGKKSDRIVQALQYQVLHRTLDRDFRYHGMDGAQAARSLAALGATESVPVLAGVLMRVDPELAKAANPEFADTPIAFLDWRVKSTIVQALGELRCESSKRALLAYLDLDEASARKIGIPMHVDATRSLLNQDLAVREIRGLLQNPNRPIRAAAVLECLDHPNKQRTEALKCIPWALELPAATARP